MKLDPIETLIRLIEAKSYSGEEQVAADVLCEMLEDVGVSVQRIDNSVVATKGTGQKGLLFNSHLDTVPAGDAWTRDPWKAEIEGDLLYGLGSTDAKSCVAAMAAAFVAAPDPGNKGRLIFAATTEEETGGMGKPNGMEKVLPTVGQLAGAIVGEPTELNIANGQRGMVRAILHVHGKAGHASRPWEGINAIELAADDIIALRELASEIAQVAEDPLLGTTTIQPTLMKAGTAKNVIPESAEIVLDIRTTQKCGNETIITRIEETVDAEVEIVSKRFLPVGTSATAAIIRAAQQALPEARLRPFGGVSDLFFLKTIPAEPVPCCLIGPGCGKQSHQPDEFVSVTMVRKAAEAYASIMTNFWETLENGH